MNRSVLLNFSISQEASLFLFPKLRFIQNISRSAFLFRLRIGIVYHKENILIIEINNSQIEQDLENTKDAVECSNQTVTVFLLQINTTCDFALS